MKYLVNLVCVAAIATFLGSVLLPPVVVMVRSRLDRTVAPLVELAGPPTCFSKLEGCL